MMCTLVGAAVAALLCLDRSLPPDLSRLQTQSLILRDADGHLLDGRTTPDGAWRLSTAAGDVDPAYLALLLRTEDRRFRLHGGVDPLAMLRAAAQRLVRGHVVSGGSTLAMQAARLLAPHRRSLAGKLVEMLRAMQLEWRLGRTGVLNAYLTLTPEGGNIEGIGAASLLYFGHDPKHLTASEAALLVALPRRPAALRPDRYPLAAERACLRVLAGGGTARPPILPAVHRWAVPHVAAHLLATLWGQAARGLVPTTIDGALQRAVTRLARSTPPPPHGEYAVIVVSPDRHVAAWLGGSAVPGTSVAGAAVDMVRARRSPGSTLKPFIYGLAFDDGLLRPDTVIDDRRMRLGDYAPQDFDRRFRGSVRADEALRQSLNLPAVQVLRLVGASRFAAALSATGVTLSLPRRGSHATLALALGGVGLTMQELAGLYVGLAAGGRVSRPRATLGLLPSSSLLTRRGANEVVQILAATEPPDGQAWGERTVAFKTGTSYGDRDAWAAGVSSGWTVVVWAGRPDGTASPGITGRTTAAPLMGRIFDLLPETDVISAVRTPATAATAPLMPLLRHLGGAEGPPQIVYPPPGAVIESRRQDGTMAPVGLEAAGGRPPYRWIANGEQLSALPGGEPFFLPDGIGFSVLSVTDAANQSSVVSFRVR